MLHRLKNNPTTTKSNSKSLGDSIKRHIFQKNLISRTPKHQQLITITPSSAATTTTSTGAATSSSSSSIQFGVSSQLLHQTIRKKVMRLRNRNVYKITHSTSFYKKRQRKLTAQNIKKTIEIYHHTI